MQTNHYMLQQQ